LSVRNIPVDDEEYKRINERRYIWTAVKYIKIWLIIAAVAKLKPEKNSGLTSVTGIPDAMINHILISFSADRYMVFQIFICKRFIMQLLIYHWKTERVCDNFSRARRPVRQTGFLLYKYWLIIVTAYLHCRFTGFPAVG